MSYNMMIGYDIYDRFTMEHFPLCQIMILTTSFFCSRQYIFHALPNRLNHLKNINVFEKFPKSVYSVSYGIGNINL
jgi:hypothetical protein